MMSATPAPLISAAAIARRVAWLGAELTRRHAGSEPVMLALLDGACCFAADLARAVAIPALELRFARASSYRGTASTGTVDLAALPAVAGRPVVLVDDILDTGLTLAAAVAALGAAGAAGITTCVLLDKPARRDPRGLARADLVGFTIPDRFVVGYGLDLDGRWRHLPAVCTLDAAPGFTPATRVLA